MKAKPGKPTPKKIGPMGLPTKDAASVAGGPIDGDCKGTGLGEGYGVKGEKGVPPLKKK